MVAARCPNGLDHQMQRPGGQWGIGQPGRLIERQRIEANPRPATNNRQRQAVLQPRRQRGRSGSWADDCFGLSALPNPLRQGEGSPTSAPHPIEIRRGCASFAFGSVSVSTPSSSCALIRS